MEVAEDILRYFLRNPGAADDLEGVALWRLPEERIYAGVQKSRNALVWLVAQGVLKQVSKGEATKLFQLNAERREDGEHLLTDLKTRRKT